MKPLSSHLHVVRATRYSQSSRTQTITSGYRTSSGELYSALRKKYLHRCPGICLPHMTTRICVWRLLMDDSKLTKEAVYEGYKVKVMQEREGAKPIQAKKVQYLKSRNT